MPGASKGSHDRPAGCRELVVQCIVLFLGLSMVALCDTLPSRAGGALKAQFNSSPSKRDPASTVTN